MEAVRAVETVPPQRQDGEKDGTAVMWYVQRCKQSVQFRVLITLLAIEDEMMTVTAKSSTTSF